MREEEVQEDFMNQRIHEIVHLYKKWRSYAEVARILGPGWSRQHVALICEDARQRGLLSREIKRRPAKSHAQRNAERRQRNEERGMCREHSTVPSAEGSAYCKQCQAAMSERSRLRREAEAAKKQAAKPKPKPIRKTVSKK